MDYKAMTAKLVAVRKEIRKNVWRLNLADEMEAKFNKGWEDMIWAGETSYAYYKRTMTFDKTMKQYPLIIKQAIEVGKFTKISKLEIALMVIQNRIKNRWNKKDN